MKDNQHLEKILDEALSEYGSAEPLAGLEDRVLQRLRLQPDHRRTAWWRWGAVAACAAMLAFAAWLGLRGREPQRPTVRQQTEASTTVVPPDVRPAAGTTRKVTNKRPPQPQIKIQAKFPRSAGAPTQVARLDDNGSRSPHLPAPLTGEERQLIALAQTHPDALREISQEDQPIAIAPLTIQPLLSEANQNGDN
jgi:hypothetical protein